MKAIITVVLCFFSITAVAQADTSQRVNPDRRNSKVQQQKPYVILISADAFRYDYAKKYNATHLLALSEAGVSAQSLMPSFPSITFPNHYTLVTGLYPSHHGLVSNRFYDPKQNKIYSKSNTEPIWYGGTPLWTLAEQQQMLSACFYWAGSDVPQKGILPTYYYPYNEKISIHNRIQDVQNWLTLPAEKRPHLITIYFPEVDKIGHKKGPYAPETIKAIHFIDSVVYELTKAVAKTGLDVNFIFLSDHGMSLIPTNNPIETPATIDTSKFIITSGEGILVNVYAKKGHEAAISTAYQQLLKEAKDYDVYLKSNVPASWHYGEKDDWLGHIGDIIMVPHYPHIFKLNSVYIDPGAHGYDPAKVKDMQATFYAWGPNFKRNLKIPSFDNVNAYPIITKILGLKYTDKIDGTNAVAKQIVIPHQ
ncbi:MAG: ectonucleotide pyrophosphatase/phosphodiesterase [Bacteroidota bacterium]